MDRLRRALGAGAFSGALGAALAFGAIRTVPWVAGQVDHELPCWAGAVGVAVVLGLFVGYGVLALPRTWGLRLLQFSLSTLLGAAVVIVVYPPSLQWVYRCPLTRDLVSKLSEWPFDDTRLDHLTYDERGLVCGSWDGTTWVLDPDDGRVIDTPKVRFAEAWSRRKKPVARTVDLDRVRAGIPLSVMLSTRELDRVYRNDGPLQFISCDGENWAWSRSSWTEHWRVRDGVRLPLPSGSPTPIPGGTLVLIEAPYTLSFKLPLIPAFTYVEVPVPGCPPPRQCRKVVTLCDGATGEVRWRRTVPYGSVRVSPKGSYVLVGSALLETATGDVLGFVDGSVEGWSPDEEWLLVPADLLGGAHTVHVPDLRATNSTRPLSLRHMAFRPDGRRLAVIEDRRVVVVTVPELRLVSETQLLHPAWVASRAGALGGGIGLFALLVSLLSWRPKSGRTEVILRAADSPVLRIGLVVYLVLCPLAAFGAERLPIALPDAWAAGSLLLLLALAIPTAFAAFPGWGRRLLAAAALVVVPGVSLLGAMMWRTSLVGETSASWFQLVDGETLVESKPRRILEIRTGREVVALETMNLQTSMFEYVREGETLRGRAGDLVCEWGLSDGRLRRVAVEPEAECSWDRDAIFVACGLKVGARLVAFAPVWEHRRCERAKLLADGRILFAQGPKLFETRVARTRFLEIPLHAALASALLALLLKVRVKS